MKKFIAAILLAHVVSFGPAVFTSGFYHDDWTVLEHANSEKPFETFSRGGFSVRPLNAPVMIGLFKAFGFNPVPWHMTIFGLHLLASVLFFLVLGGGRFALVAALIAGTFPGHAITHHWISSIPALLALNLALGALLAPSFIAGTVLYAGALLSYEAVAFLPLIAFWRGWRPAKARYWAFLLPLVVVLVYQKQFKQRPATFSPRHVMTVILEGLKCVTYKIG